jgi:hypothetical protein
MAPACDFFGDEVLDDPEGRAVVVGCAFAVDSGASMGALLEYCGMASGEYALSCICANVLLNPSST